MAKVYRNTSRVISGQFGLFAKEDIKAGDLFVEFTGDLKKPGQKTTSNRSNIFFNDEHVLQCGPDDLASFANDAISFPAKPRKLFEALMKREPLYKKYEGANLNAEIKIKNKTHRAYLRSLCDIKKDEEIFCHYGFEYWFRTEIHRGILPEDYIARIGLPKKIFTFPSFNLYIYEFYPQTRKIVLSEYTPEITDVQVHSGDGVVVIPLLNDYQKSLQRIMKPHP